MRRTLRKKRLVSEARGEDFCAEGPGGEKRGRNLQGISDSINKKVGEEEIVPENKEKKKFVRTVP